MLILSTTAIMTFRDTPIQRKIILVIMFTAVSALLLAGAMFFALKVRSFQSDLLETAGSLAAVIGANSQAALEFEDNAAGESTLAALREDSRIVSAVLYDREGHEFATYKRPELSEITIEQSRDYPSVSRDIILEGRPIGRISLQVNLYEGLYKRLYEFAVVALLVLCMAGLGAYFISRRLQRLISAPIINLTKTARKISREKDYTLRVPKVSNDEVGVLIDRFNEMLEQIRKQDDSLRDSENQIRLITDSLPVYIAYVDFDLKYKFINRAYEAWLGKSRDEVIDKPISQVINKESYEVKAPYIRKVLTGEVARYEASLNYDGRASKYVSGTMVPDIDPASGKIKGYFSLIHDISERKRAEDELMYLNERLEQRVMERTEALEQSQERLRQSERLASIGTLAAGMAHEIRNPVNSISLAAQHALRYEKEISTSLHKVLDMIAAEAKRCGAIIKNILLFAKSEKTNKTLGDLNEVVEKAVNLVKSYSLSAKAEISLNLADGLNPVLLNSTEIEQVIVNIVHNAIEASPAGVSVKLETHETPTGVILSIQDNGPGIPEELLSRIFDPFFSTKRKQGNTGLGLSLCHGIVTEHGGSLTVRSATNGGTVFNIEFPKVEYEAANFGG